MWQEEGKMLHDDTGKVIKIVVTVIAVALIGIGVLIGRLLG
jgi:hypothetical protein